MNGGIAVQLAVDSFAAAALYAIVGIAAALAYGGSGAVHLALGQIGAAGGLTAAALWQSGLPLALSIVAGIAVGAVLSGLAERGLVAPAMGRPVLAAVLLLGAGVVLQEVLLAVFPHPVYGFPVTPGSFGVLGGVVHAADLVTIAVTAAVAAAGFGVIGSSRAGTALRLTAVAPVMAERLGVDTARIRTAAFATSGALAAGAAMLAAARFPIAASGGGAVIVVLRGLAAAAAGRMTIAWRIGAGALAIGVAEVVGQYWLGAGGELCADACAVLLVVVGWRR